jgi:methyltransferase (TIGR00027 family)
MVEAQPSRTALRVALRRAAHQIVDEPLVFTDPLAVRIVGAALQEELARTPDKRRRPASAGLRAFLVARSRYAEEQLEKACAAGVRQYCLLGAGLDTFAYRHAYPNLRVFEVDHPATQAWKRQMLSASEIGIPLSATFVPVDFERQDLRNQLGLAGFAFDQPCFFAWLGVVHYLSLEAFRTTLSVIAAMPQGSGVTFDYSLPRESLAPHEQLEYDSLAARVALAGEPFQVTFTPEAIRAELSAFTRIEDLDTPTIAARFFAGRTDGLNLRGSAGRLLTAWR